MTTPPLAARSQPTPLTAPALYRGGNLDHLLRWMGRQRWLRYGVRERLLNRLRHPDRLAQRCFEADFAGFRYPGDLGRSIDWLVYYVGAYELEELELIRERLRRIPAPVALDVGANVGHHTLFLASCCSAVHAFEPFEPVARHIDEKIARNGLQHVHVHRVGLSDSDARLPYYPPSGSNVGNGSFAPHDDVTVPTQTLSLRHGDRYLAALDLPRIDFVKIDVEGFELQVLRGLQATLRRHRPVLMLELSHRTRGQIGSFDDFVALLPPGYRVQRIVPPQPRGLLFSSGKGSLAPLDWQACSRGDYANLLLEPE